LQRKKNKTKKRKKKEKQRKGKKKMTTVCRRLRAGGMIKEKKTEISDIRKTLGIL
jgi:hypothetical protein